jgi:hypothetical protein
MKRLLFLIPALMLAFVAGYLAKETAGAQWTPPVTNPIFGHSITGTSTQTFTNSPCTALTTEVWIPVTIYGTAGGNYYIPACQ